MLCKQKDWKSLLKEGNFILPYLTLYYNFLFLTQETIEFLFFTKFGNNKGAGTWGGNRSHTIFWKSLFIFFDSRFAL